MNFNEYFSNYDLEKELNSKKNSFVKVVNKTGLTPESLEVFRFEEKKERYTWVKADEIYFVKSADHYVKSLIKCGDQKKWMSRHSTLKEMIEVLPPENFVRLNKFYLLNLNYFSHIDQTENILHFNDSSSIPVDHRISPYIRHLLNRTYT
jgi:DNA-binding LytR/AlgR family response regulator